MCNQPRTHILIIRITTTQRTQAIYIYSNDAKYSRHEIYTQISRKAPQHTARGSHSNTYNQQRRKSKNTRANNMNKYSCFEYRFNVAQCTFYASYKYIYRWTHLYARKHIDILQFQCICSLARGLFYFLTNTASMMLLSTRNHTYKSFTPKPQKKQSQTPEASSAFNNTCRLFHIKPITHHHVICIFDFLSFYSPASPSPLLICYICFFLILYINIVFHASAL